MENGTNGTRKGGRVGQPGPLGPQVTGFLPSGLVVDPQPEIWQVLPGTGQWEANGSGFTCLLMWMGRRNLMSIRSPSLVVSL